MAYPSWPQNKKLWSSARMRMEKGFHLSQVLSAPSFLEGEGKETKYFRRRPSFHLAFGILLVHGVPLIQLGYWSQMLKCRLFLHERADWGVELRGRKGLESSSCANQQPCAPVLAASALRKGAFLLIHPKEQKVPWPKHQPPNMPRAHTAFSPSYNFRYRPTAALIHYYLIPTRQLHCPNYFQSHLFNLVPISFAANFIFSLTYYHSVAMFPITKPCAKSLNVQLKNSASLCLNSAEFPL